MDELARVFSRLIEGSTEKGSSDSITVTDGLLDCARANKISVLVGRGVDLPHQSRPIREALLQDRRVASLSNAHILHLVHTAHDVLLQASIPHFFYKGPVQQKILYGDFFAKRSSDADLMVRSQDFDRARRALGEAGFRVARTCDGPWWRYFLGEQHLFHADKGGRSLDLHYRFQQPGCPAPKCSDALFKRVISVEVGGVKVPSMDLIGVALIAAMNFVKAIHHREPAASYAIDLLVGLAKMDDSARVDLVQEARRQRLSKTLAFAVCASAVAFGMRHVAGVEPMRLPLPDNLIQTMVLEPHKVPSPALKRSYLLFLLSDDKIFQFTGEVARWGASEACRLIFQRQE